MHTSMLTLALLLAVQPLASAQTLIDSVATHSGYGGPVLQLTSLGGAAAVMTSARGGWIANDRFVLGGTFAWTTATEADSNHGLRIERRLAYGGVLLEYIVASRALLHPVAELVLGTGSATVRDFASGEKLDRSLFFLVQPGATLVFNVTPFFRLAAGGGYRMALGHDLAHTAARDLDGPFAQVVFKFGGY